MELRHEWRTVNGVRLHCVTAGSGPLVVLLHGFPEFWYSWRHQLPVLAEHFTVVAPDLRGYNLSDKPARLADYTLPVLIEDVVQLIHAFGAERAILLGHDWGGAVAWATALTRPDVVEKLVVLNIPHPRLFLQNLLVNAHQMLRSWYIGFFQLPWLPEAAIRANDYRAIEEAFRVMAVHDERFPEDVIEAYKRAIAQPGALTAALNYYRALRRSFTFVSQMNPIARMPVLVVWGEQDAALGKELNQGLEHYVPNLTIHFLPDAGHWVQHERPDLVNRYILDFIAPQ